MVVHIFQLISYVKAVMVVFDELVEMHPFIPKFKETFYIVKLKE